MIRKNETICAQASPGGGALTVIRVSGSRSISICSKIFIPASEKIKLTDLPGNRVVFGEIKDGGKVIDEVLLTIFRAPHSYTGEDSVEISCHGSEYIVSKLLELLIRNGAAPARPGEFTMRAFMNGKMDLSQAEAVADLVASSSEAAHRLAVNQLKGGFSENIRQLRNELLQFASLIELELDFGEEDVEFADRQELLALVHKIRSITDSLASSFITGNAIKNGIPVVITGKPNSGKSTLLNAILMEDRAIVSDIPGTTRDAIEDTIIIDGIRYRFIDTAGLRTTSDRIELLGIKKTREKINQAEVIILTEETTEDPVTINERISGLRDITGNKRKKIIIALNKTDLTPDLDRENLRGKIKLNDNESLVFISAKEKTGLEVLKAELARSVEKQRLNSGDVIITNIRHYEALTNVSKSLEQVEEGLKEGISGDLLAVDVRQAIYYLGEITGEITSDEILGNIFRNFCIGK